MRKVTWGDLVVESKDDTVEFDFWSYSDGETAGCVSVKDVSVNLFFLYWTDFLRQREFPLTVDGVTLGLAHVSGYDSEKGLSFNVNPQKGWAAGVSKLEDDGKGYDDLPDKPKDEEAKFDDLPDKPKDED